MSPLRSVLRPLAAGALLFLAAAPARAALFTFESDPLAAQTPFSSSSGGLTATFAGSTFADPGAFQISYDSASGTLPLYRSLSGGVLATALGSLDPASPLTISFSAPVSSLSVDFALGARTGSLSLTTDAGGATAASGAVPAGYAYAEGTLRFSGARFTTATLQTSAPGFAVDDVSATAAPAALPEPASIALLGAGLVGMARRRRA